MLPSWSSLLASIFVIPFSYIVASFVIGLVYSIFGADFEPMSFDKYIIMFTAVFVLAYLTDKQRKEKEEKIKNESN